MSKWKPMTYKGTHLVLDDVGRLVATAATLEDAENIIREHNAHEALLTACKGMLADDIVDARETLDYGPGGTGPEELADDLIEEREEAARIAIALAEPTP